MIRQRVVDASLKSHLDRGLRNHYCRSGVPRRQESSSRLEKSRLVKEKYEPTRGRQSDSPISPWGACVGVPASHNPSRSEAGCRFPGRGAGLLSRASASLEPFAKMLGPRAGHAIGGNY
jgi:hypothetical protein